MPLVAYVVSLVHLPCSHLLCTPTYFTHTSVTKHYNCTITVNICYSTYTQTECSAVSIICDLWAVLQWLSLPCFWWVDSPCDKHTDESHRVTVIILVFLLAYSGLLISPEAWILLVPPCFPTVVLVEISGFSWLQSMTTPLDAHKWNTSNSLEAVVEFDSSSDVITTVYVLPRMLTVTLSSVSEFSHFTWIFESH